MVVDGEESDSERCLKMLEVRWWGRRVIKEYFQKHFKIGDGQM